MLVEEEYQSTINIGPITLVRFDSPLDFFFYVSDFAFYLLGKS